MAAKGIKQPRTLNVQKFAESRATELEALHSIVSDRLNADFRSHRNKRRRTNGYDNRVGKKRYINRPKNLLLNENKEKDLKKKLPRHVRRKVELRRNPESGFCVSGDGSKRLRTHVWYAKRFTMTKLWGFHLPLGLHGRGRGSRSIMKSFRDGVIVHDSSYCGAVQLEGPEEKLFSILSMVLKPSSSDSEGFSCSLLSGVAYGSAMLHHVGAACSHTIAPVTYMWRPHQQSGNPDMHKSDGSDDIVTIDNSSAFRLIWIWIHAAAFDEGYDALESACRRENEKAGALVKCISLDGQLGKLEVMGSKASQLLQKIIQPVTSFPQSNWELKDCSVAEAQDEAQPKNSSVFESEDNISSSIVSLIVNDPRTLAGKDEHQTSTSIPQSSIESGENINLWLASNGILPPVKESILCTEKYHQRLASYCLHDNNTNELNAPTEEQCSRVCPIMLLRNSYPENSISRWSILLPLSWVKTFWISLVSNGARAIGLREKHWIACEIRLPYFPSDFPGCNAYSRFMETEAAASGQNAELHPPSVRPLSVPTSPPWEIVRHTFSKTIWSGLHNQTHPNILSSENMIDHNLSTNSHGDCHRAPCCSNGALFDGLVPRSSHLLSQFGSGVNDCQLLIFPHMPDRENCISKIMKEKELFSRCPNAATFPLNHEHRLCFIRVLLRAYKDGVFEDGAVVCAPHLSDLMFCTSGSYDNKFELQIPRTLLKSYFVQQPCGKWDHQDPDNPVASENHRWPIGFVTTGFVYGSKKPVAGALCEAVLLAHLREEQWNAVAVKRRRKEIYVLVRNLRSTAYRLAIAEIVLEQQEQDVDYIGKLLLLLLFQRSQDILLVVPYYDMIACEMVIMEEVILKSGVADYWTSRRKHYNHLDTRLKNEAFMLGTSKGKHDKEGFKLFITTACVPDLNESSTCLVQEIEEVDTYEHYRPTSPKGIISVTLKLKHGI